MWGAKHGSWSTTVILLLLLPLPLAMTAPRAGGTKNGNSAMQV